MTCICIIDNSYLVRSALVKLLQMYDERIQIHEMTTLDELDCLISKQEKVVVFVNKKLLSPEDYQKNKILPKQIRKVVFISYQKENALNTDKKVIYLDDDINTLHEKLKKILDLNLNEKGKNSGAKNLSKRETDILKYVALGLTNKEIADKLYISIHTVITHRKNISVKLGIKTIAGFTVYALLNHIILPSELV